MGSNQFVGQIEFLFASELKEEVKVQVKTVSE